MIRKTILLEDGGSTLSMYTGVQEFEGCQCFKDCSCKEDYVPYPFIYYRVLRLRNIGKYKSTRHDNLLEAIDRWHFISKFKK